MTALTIQSTCCGKEMTHNPCAQVLENNVNLSQYWVCFECGRFVSLTDEQLDEEELQRYKDLQEVRP